MKLLILPVLVFAVFCVTGQELMAQESSVPLCISFPGSNGVSCTSVPKIIPQAVKHT